jgi:hypothetical protein
MAEKIEELEKRIADLEKRFDKLSDRVIAIDAKPKSVKETPLNPRKLNEILEEELAGLEANPESFIQAKVELGLTSDQAEKAVTKRKEFLRVELGKTPRPRRAPKAAGAAALMIGLLMAVFALATPARAQDQQGTPQRFVTMTNIPPIFNATGSNAMTATFGLANVVYLHRGTGIGLAWTFNAPAGVYGLMVRPSVDGTNYDSAQQWWLYGTGVGAGQVTVDTNWNVNQLTGYRSLEIDAETNVASAGKLTNDQTLFNVPAGGP